MRPHRFLQLFLNSILALSLALPGLLSRAEVAMALSPDIVISQVYGGGGNSGATYTHDFIELFNRGASPVSLAGWSVQYASATGTGNFGANSSQLTELPNTSLAPGQYLLIQEASTAAVGSPLPTPDVTDATPITMAAGAGKVALVNTTASLGCNGGSTPCSPAQLAQIIDLVGYGTANFFEGAAAAPTLSSTTAAIRAGNGCTETDNNSTDFMAGAPAPRNTASPLNPCPLGISLSINDVTMDEGESGTTSFEFTVSLSGPALAGGVTFDIATADNTATAADNDYVASSLSGQSIPEGSSSYTFNVLVNGDMVYELDENFFVNVTNVTGATISDEQGLGTIVNDDIGICGDPSSFIHEVQGSGLVSPLAGANVVIEGVVVGDFQNNAQPDNGNLNGFHIQEEDSEVDGDPATSEGVFVFAPGSIDVSVGDLVRVRGIVTEFNGLTEISGVSLLLQCSTGNSLPAATNVDLPVTSLDDFERYEGMLVTFPQALYISEFFNFDRFGEIVLTAERQHQPTALAEPDSPEATAIALANSLSRITLDDGRSNMNPDPAIHPNGNVFDLTNLFRGGDMVQNVTGVMDFAFGLYRIQPTQGADYTSANPRPEEPEDVGGGLKVASFNVLNYFTTLDDGVNDICGPQQDQECRGADTPEEFERQRAKIVAALAVMNADIVGLIEIENHPGDVPTADLVSGLNDELGAGTYDYIATGAIGTDAIRVAFIYKPSTVTPVGAFAVLDTSVDPRFLDDFNRPVLAQAFQDNETGGIFTVAVNHLKSKGSDCNDVGDPDTGDGQGNCNLTRLAAAQALVDWLATDPTGSGDADALIIGDLNSYDKEDPIDAILVGSDDTPGTIDDFADLIFQNQGEFAYSYLFDGQLGYLDHALANPTIAAQVTGATVWHINADEPDLIDYDTTFKQPAQDAIYAPDAYRSSDHDPVIVGLGLNGSPSCSAAMPSLASLWPANHRFFNINILGVTDPEGDPITITIGSIFQDEAVDAPDSGNTAPDGQGLGTATAQVRSERVGTGNGRVYHITFTASDDQGGSCSREVLVGVPISQDSTPAVDDGPLFDSTVVP